MARHLMTRSPSMADVRRAIPSFTTENIPDTDPQPVHLSPPLPPQLSPPNRPQRHAPAAPSSRPRTAAPTARWCTSISPDLITSSTHLLRTERIQPGNQSSRDRRECRAHGSQSSNSGLEDLRRWRYLLGPGHAGRMEGRSMGGGD